MSNTNDIVNRNKLQEGVRFFFNNISWKKSLTFLLCLFLSIVFWIMQVYTQKIEIKLSIPVKYTNVANNILFENDLPTNIEVYVKDNGYAAAKYFIRNNDSLVIDMGSIIKESTPSSSKVIQGQTYEQFVRSMLFPSSELLNFTPAYISYAYNRVSTKKIPLIFDGETNLSPGYQLNGDISVFPDSVIAYGTRAALDTIRYAYTTRDTLHNIKESQNIQVDLRTLKGIQFKPNRATLKVPVDEFTSKEVIVPVTCINLPDDLNIKFFPPSIKISFYVGLKRYNLIQSSDFKILVDYKDIKDSKSSSIPVRIIESPEYVRIRTLDPAEAEFLLEQR